jgi:hypothetical protein
MLDQYLWQYVTSTGKRHGTIEVSPDTAQRILDNAGPQRRLIKNQIARYARWMKEGRWIDDAGGDILFDTESRARGGQHRLLAQLEAGVSVSYKIRWDQTEEEIAADSEGGTPWRASDIAGGDLPNAQYRQAIATMLLQIDQNQGEIGARPAYKPGRLDVARYVNDPRVVRAAEVAQNIRTTIGVIPSAVGAMYALAVDSGRGDPHSFFEKIRTGAGMDTNDPALTVRNMLQGSAFKNLEQRQWQTAYVLARAWNYSVENERVAKLQRFTPPTNKPIRPLGWKPFFSK